MKRKCLIVIGFLMIFLCMYGCGSKGSAPVVDVDMSPILTDTGGTAGNEDIVIGSVTMISEGEWYGEVLSGVRAAAADLGITLLEASSESDKELENKYVNDFIDKKVDGLIICPINNDTGAILTKAENEGIPVVTWNTVVEAPVTASVCVDAAALGGATGDYLIEYIHTHNLSGLKLGMITNESYTIGVARCDGFRDSLKDLIKDGTITIVSEKLAETTEETNAAVAAMLQEQPDLDFLWCWNQTSLIACIDIVKASGNTDLIILGTDMSVGLARDMQGDAVNLLAVTTQLPYNIGYKAVVNAVKAVKGEAVDATVMIPTFTYTKEDTDGLSQYIETHAAFE